MPDDRAIAAILQAPSVLGYVHCAQSGEVLARHGQQVDTLAMLLGHVMKLAQMLGRALGLDDLHETQLHGKPLTALCMPYRGGAVGVLLDSRARQAEVAQLLRNALQGA
jgi:hypothetical protein